MKKRVLSIIIAFLGMVLGAKADVEINEQNFPDWNFRTYVKNWCEFERFDGVLTDSEIAQITEINAVSLNIEDFTGIEYFTELKELDVFGNGLTSLDVSHNTKLERLDCGSNQLTSIDVSENTVLRMLFCSGNKLTSLNVSNNPNLAYLDCSNNKIGYAEMRKLVESLPLYQPTTEMPLGLFTVLDRDNDQNFITAAQVNIAKAKNWQVVSYSPYGGLENYNGFVDIPINATNFPDATFKSWVSSKYDTDSDGFLGFEEIDAVTSIDVTAMSISSLKGIEYFTALTDLNCSGNRLTTLDVSGCTALENLVCSNDKLAALDVSGCTALENLDCSSNKLAALDVSNCTALTELWCGSNQLAALDVSHCTALTTLWCGGNQLTALDVSHCKALTNLNCGGNQLTKLDVSDFTALEYLYCDVGQLEALDVSHCTALKELYCSENQLEALDVSNCTALEYLYCYDNKLMSLNVSNCTALRYLYCYDNQLISLNVSDCTALGALNCSNNQLIYLFVSNYMAALSFLQCNNNQISGKQMTSLIDNLPTSEGIGLFRVYNPDGTDGNLISTVQVKAAKAKNWHVLTNDDYEYYGVVTGLAIDATNFPDDIFRQQVNNFDKDYDGFLSPTEIASVKQVLVPEMGISNLKGIEHFTAMTMLICYNNQLTSLDLRNNTALSGVNCSNNQLTSLDVSYCKTLMALECFSNQLTELDVSGCSALTELSCYDNQLEYLNGLSDCRALKRLECYKNQIRGDGMTYLVDCLRTIDTSQEDPGWMAVYFEGIDDDNEMMTRHVEAAKDNGWTVQMYDGTEWVDYPGVPFYVEIDEDTFTDPNFRSWVLAQNYGADGVLTEDELDAVTEMDLSGLGIEQLDGIQYFTALKKLVCSNNNISYLWLDNNQQLSELWIDNNEIWGYAIVYLLRDLSDNGGVIRLFSTSATEGNGFTTAQVDALKAKGWRVLTRDGADYAGIDQGVPIIQRNFPDDAFRYMIIRGFDGDLDGYLNQVEIQHTKSFDTYLVSRGIKSLTGIEYFTSLNELTCWINSIDGSFVNLLPETTDGILNFFYGEGRDNNSMLPAEIHIANQKGWRVLRDGGSDYLGVIVEGDADGDGEVSMQDVERLSDYILGRNSKAFSLKSADLDDSGTADITDLTKLIEKLKKVKR